MSPEPDSALDDLSLIGFVVCRACGTKIAADREHCLRCGAPLHEPLEPAPGDDAAAPDAGDRAVLQAGSLILVLLVVVAALFLNRAPRPGDASSPADQEGPNASSNSASEGSAGQSAPPYSQPVTFIDSARAATAAYTAGNFEAARAGYEQSITKQPDDPDSLSNLGQVLVRLGRTAEAVPLFERAIGLAPEKWAYRFNLAHAVGQLGQWDRAVSEYREAARLFPTDYATTFNLAMALHKKGDEAAAIPEFQKAIELAPGEASFHVSLGVSLEAAGRVNDALAEFKRYLELAPTAPDAQALKAHVDALVSAQTRPQSPS